MGVISGKLHREAGLSAATPSEKTSHPHQPPRFCTSSEILHIVLRKKNLFSFTARVRGCLLESRPAVFALRVFFLRNWCNLLEPKNASINSHASFAAISLKAKWITSVLVHLTTHKMEDGASKRKLYSINYNLVYYLRKKDSLECIEQSTWWRAGVRAVQWTEQEIQDQVQV